MCARANTCAWVLVCVCVCVCNGEREREKEIVFEGLKENQGREKEGARRKSRLEK